MADKSPIEWTDATWQIVTGCEIESPGCTNCYAMRLAGTRLRNHPSRVGLTRDSAAGPVWTGEVRFNEQWLRQPLQWTRPRMIFVAAHGDLFHPAVRTEWLDKIFAVMALSKRHTFQCLTKRPQVAREYLRQLMTRAGRLRIEAAAREMGYTFEFQGDLLLGLPLQNVLIGASVENQRYADIRRDPMVDIAAMGWRTWVSYEPALGMVDWSGWEFLHWLVSGGEAGPGARPAHTDCHREARDWCARNGVAYLFKQHGAWAPWEPGHPAQHVIYLTVDGSAESGPGIGREPRVSVGKKAAGRLLDGRTHDGFPEVSHA